MKHAPVVIALASLAASCSAPQGPKPAAAVSERQEGVIDLQWYSQPLSVLIQVEDVGLHPATGAGLISQLKGRVITVREGSLPPCTHVLITISTADAGHYTIGSQYLLTRDSGGGIVSKENFKEQPGKQGRPAD